MSALLFAASQSHPLPSGPLSRMLQHPDRITTELLAGLRAVLVYLLPWVIGIAVLGVAALVLRARLRDAERRQAGIARRLVILPPPEIDADSAALLWMGLHALLRPWWRRIVYGQPHLSWEITARADDVEVGVWVPASVPLSLVVRAIEVAFPGAQTKLSDQDPLRAEYAPVVATEVARAGS